MISMICFAMAAINVLFIVDNPSGTPWNWASLVFCFGVGIASAIRE